MSCPLCPDGQVCYQDMKRYLESGHTVIDVFFYELKDSGENY